MNTVTKLIYTTICEYEEDGVDYAIFKESMREHLLKEPSYTFLCEVELPLRSKEEVYEAGLAMVDREISGHHAAILGLKAKKQSLMAIEQLPEEE